MTMAAVLAALATRHEVAVTETSAHGLSATSPVLGSTM
jgi:hypothetical protein